LKLEVIVIPVSNVDRAKEFYTRLGWRLDADFAGNNGLRLVQFTLPGSGSSVQFGVSLTPATPGSTQGLLLAVSDIKVARQQLIARGLEASEVFHCATATGCRFPGIGARVSGPHPDHLSYGSFASFQRAGRQWLGAAGSHNAASGMYCPRHDVCIGTPPSLETAKRGHDAGNETRPRPLPRLRNSIAGRYR
jgi:catechol 2,3-dioxygenase-like lactoylglutathione lyase family enzyme